MAISVRFRRSLIAASVVGAGSLVTAGLIGAAGSAQAAGTLPCDLYASGGTPCVAAHSTTRARYSAYNGRLYQIRRSSDNTTRDITTLNAGGTANAPPGKPTPEAAYGVEAQPRSARATAAVI